MSHKFENKRGMSRTLSSIGLIVGLVSMPSLVRAGGDEMNMRMGKTPADAAQQPTPNMQPPCEGMGAMKPSGGKPMGMGMMGMEMGMMNMKDDNPGMSSGHSMEGQPGKSPMTPYSNAPTGATNTPNGTNVQPDSTNNSTTRGLYHAGSTDFFLDQSEQLALTGKQKADLTEIKRVTLAKTGSLQNKIAQNEQELFGLTGVDSPNQQAVEKKVREIEKLRSEQRVSYINSVGKAARVLNENQRKTYATR